MDNATYNQYKLKIQQADLLRRQIKGLQAIAVDLDTINQQFKEVLKLSVNDTPEQRRAKLEVLSPNSSTYRNVQLYFKGSSNLADYSMHDKTGIPLHEVSLLITPYLIDIVESLLDSKTKELEEL